jgi:hypothetical protein
MFPQAELTRICKSTDHTITCIKYHEARYSAWTPPHHQFYVCSVQIPPLPFQWVCLDLAPGGYGHHSPNCLLITANHQVPNFIVLLGVGWKKCWKLDWHSGLITSVPIANLRDLCTTSWHSVSVKMITCIQYPNWEPKRFDIDFALKCQKGVRIISGLNMTQFYVIYNEI